MRVTPPEQTESYGIDMDRVKVQTKKLNPMGIATFRHRLSLRFQRFRSGAEPPPQPRVTQSIRGIGSVHGQGVQVCQAW